MGYTASMTITHQTLLDEEGKPTAAVIPWDEFKEICDRLEEDDDGKLSPEWRSELDRRVREIKEGTVQTIANDEVFAQVREQLRSHPSSRQSA